MYIPFSALNHDIVVKIDKFLMHRIDEYSYVHRVVSSLSDVNETVITYFFEFYGC